MIKVDKIVPGGQGLGSRDDGKKVFFWNVLPGEIVDEYDVVKNKSHYVEAIATKISQPSEFRVEPRDNCFLSTSPWQIISYDYELKLKQQLVVEMFREHRIKIGQPKIYTDGQEYNYRNKMEYALYWDNEAGEIKLAFHRRGTHRKIPIDSSSIERPEILECAQGIIKQLNKQHEEAREYQSLLLRCNQNGKTSGGLYENHQPHPRFDNLEDTIMGYKYSYSPNGFFQINLPVYEMVLEEIKKHVKTEKVLDLYAGVGTIGLSVARDKQLTLVEVDKSAYGEMVKNASGLTNVRVILDKSENVTNYIEPDMTVILDPPRAGCDHRLLAELNRIQPNTVIYLSCNPATQARDVEKLSENYQIIDVKTYNFFPHTPHIENLVILTKSC